MHLERDWVRELEKQMPQVTSGDLDLALQSDCTMRDVPAPMRSHPCSPCPEERRDSPSDGERIMSLSQEEKRITISGGSRMSP